MLLCKQHRLRPRLLCQKYQQVQASPAGDVAMGGDDVAAASPVCGDQLPYTTPMNVISNPLYASNQRT